MYNIAICDDDINYINLLKGYISKVTALDEIADEVEICAYFSGEALLKDMHQQFDLIFLDMCMCDLSGYETARDIRAANKYTVLAFCTGTQVPQPEHFNVQPYRYMLKSYPESKMLDDIEALLEEMKRRRQNVYLVITDDGCSAKLNIDDIIYISKIKRGSCIKMLEQGVEKECTTKMRLQDIEDKVGKYRFASPHSSFLINLSYIKEVRVQEIVLDNKECISISRSHKEEFHKRFSKFQGQKYQRTKNHERT